MIGGHLKSWNSERGYGFLLPDDGSGDVFLHISTLIKAGFADPSVGLRFMFEIGTRGDGKTGKPRTVINIEKAAKLSTVDRQRSGLGFDRVEQTPRSGPPSPEAGSVGMEAA